MSKCLLKAAKNIQENKSMGFKGGLLGKTEDQSESWKWLKRPQGYAAKITGKPKRTEFSERHLAEQLHCCLKCFHAILEYLVICAPLLVPAPANAQLGKWQMTNKVLRSVSPLWETQTEFQTSGVSDPTQHRLLTYSVSEDVRVSLFLSLTHSRSYLFLSLTLSFPSLFFSSIPIVLPFT